MDYMPDTETLSTTLDTEAGPSGAGGGQVAETTEPNSLRADLEAAFKEDAAKPPEADKVEDKKATADKPDDKPENVAKEPEAKDAKEQTKPEDVKADRQRADDGKFARAEREGEQREGKRFVEAPKNFLPAARDVWRNTPHAVQTEVARLVQEHERTSEQTKQTVERYESLRHYDEVAKGNGRDLRESLERMSHVETLLQKNPLAGLNAILMEIGPRKADGQPFSLYEVAQFVAQQEPQSYQQMVAQGQEPQQPKEDPRIAQLQQQLAQVQEQTAQQTIIEPFARSHPRYAELEQDIAFFLQSGKVPASLSPYDRLAAAYDMAERMNPPSHIDDQAAHREGLADIRRADDDFSGSKSIKSSPGSVTETYDPEAKPGESIRDSLRAEARRMNR
jgi:hypothetical protein